jgi:glycosyltransferase involved in cell wall biosynthesis
MGRIVRVQSRICVGGPAHHTILLSEALSRARGSKYDTLLVGGGLEPGEVSLAPTAHERGVPLRIVDTMRRPVRPRQDAKALAEVTGLLRQERPTIVHTHTAKAGAIGRSAAIAQRVPIKVHTFHGHVFDGYFDPSVARRFLQVERALARFTDRILVLSSKQKDDIVERYRIAPERKVCVVPLGLQLDRFRRARRTHQFRREIGLTDEPLVVSIGRFVPIKRLDRLVRAFRNVNARDSRAHLVFVGDGDAEVRSELERASAGLNVHFVGYRNDTDAILADADVLALTSDNEGTPVAVIESLVAGTPVVATDVGGVREIVPPGAGAVVPKSDEERLAEALGAALTTPSRLSDDVRDDVLERYSHRRLIRDIEALYDELLDGHRARTRAFVGYVGKRVSS